MELTISWANLKHDRSQPKTNYFMDHFKFKLEKNSLLTKMDLQSADSTTPLTDHQAYLIGYTGRRCSTIGRLVEVCSRFFLPFLMKN